VLGEPVDGRVRRGHQPGQAGGRDDRAAAGPPHGRQHGLQPEPHAVDVDPQHPPVGLERHVLDPLLVDGDAGVEVGPVQAAVVLLGHRNGTLARLRVADVDLDEHAADLVGHRLAASGVDIGDHDAVTPGRQRARNRGADPHRPAGDEGDAAHSRAPVHRAAGRGRLV